MSNTDSEVQLNLRSNGQGDINENVETASGEEVVGMETASESESDAERPQVINRRTEEGDNCTPGESRTPVHTATPRAINTRDYSSQSEDEDIPPLSEPRHRVRQRTQYAKPNPHADYRDIPRYSRSNRCNSNNREQSDPSQI